MEKDLAGNEGGGVLHPIGVVAKRTGISLHVLRAWERRYGVVEPVRTAGGQRLYTDAHIERLRLLRVVTDAGRSISHVVSLPDEELRALALEDAATSPPPTPEADAYLRECLAAGEVMDGAAVYASLMRALVTLRPAEFLGGVMLPLLHEVGERWHAGRIGPAHEHVVSVSARRVLTWLLEAYEPPPGAPTVVLTTVSGEQHEFGAMIAGVQALEEGWRVLYLGASLPPEEIARAALLVNAPLVAVSVVNRNGGPVTAEVERLRELLPRSVRILAGGAGAAASAVALQEAGAEVVTELEATRLALRRHRQAVRR